MIYRETGQFKANYQDDQALFPIDQDRYVIYGVLFVTFAVVPMLLNEYWLNAILLPHVLRFNEPAVGERYAALNTAMGLAEDADTAAAVADLTAELGLPTKLSELGVTASDIKIAAPLAETDHTNSTNPRKAGTADYRELLERAF